MSHKFCPDCGRLIGTRRTGVFYSHLNLFVKKPCSAGVPLQRQNREFGKYLEAIRSNVGALLITMPVLRICNRCWRPIHSHTREELEYCLLTYSLRARMIKNSNILDTMARVARVNTYQESDRWLTRKDFKHKGSGKSNTLLSTGLPEVD